MYGEPHRDLTMLLSRNARRIAAVTREGRKFCRYVMWNFVEIFSTNAAQCKTFERIEKCSPRYYIQP